MLVRLLIFLGSAAAIYLACEYFVNAIEWCGQRMKLGAMAVGALLAAFGTALPESTVTFMAVVLGRTDAERQLGVGAALGGPLVLSTIAYAIVGVALLTRGQKSEPLRIPPGGSAIRRDQGFFLILFAVNVALGLTSFPGKQWLALGFVAAYGIYAWNRARNAGAVAEAEHLEPLKLHPAHATLGWAALQAVAALAVITVASRVFVLQLGAIAVALHCPPQLAALLLSPIATELPETLNAVIWVRQGKPRLALANISGSMMIQATIPAALGIFFTEWRFDRSLLVSGLVTMAAIAFLWLVFSAKTVRPWALVSVCVFYAIFGISVASYFLHRWEHVPADDHVRANPVAGNAEAMTAGKALFATHCASCHRDGGQGPRLAGGRLRKATDGDVEWFLRQGDMGQGMPSWHSLAGQDRWRVVSYLRSLQ
ncbi:MAG: c-type cytochrome [Terracidiphilus sp.]|nr:c-type cytochrome [Terracidiphilus sp.]